MVVLGCKLCCFSKFVSNKETFLDSLLLKNNNDFQSYILVCQHDKECLIKNY